MNTSLNNSIHTHSSNLSPVSCIRVGGARFVCLIIAGTALASLLLVTGAVQAQESLRDTLRTQGVDWIVGRWTGDNGQGLPVVIEYEWELEGHLLEIDLTLDADGYKGAILRKPVDDELVELGADNAGGMTRATWEVKDGAFISKRTGTRPNGEVVRIAVVNRKVDADHVTATVHLLSAEGEPGEEVLDTVKLTRAPQEADED